jgi:hypothetical protein
MANTSGPIYTTPTGIGNWQDPALSQDPNAVSALNNIMGSYAPGTSFQHINDSGFVNALDNLIQYGSYAASAVAGGEAAFGTTTAGPGAAAIGGSAGDIAVGSALPATGAPLSLSDPVGGGFTGDSTGGFDPTGGLGTDFAGVGVPGSSGTLNPNDIGMGPGGFTDPTNPTSTTGGSSPWGSIGNFLKGFPISNLLGAGGILGAASLVGNKISSDASSAANSFKQLAAPLGTLANTQLQEVQTGQLAPWQQASIDKMVANERAQASQYLSSATGGPQEVGGPGASSTAALDLGRQIDTNALIAQGQFVHQDLNDYLKTFGDYSGLMSKSIEAQLAGDQELEGLWSSVLGSMAKGMFQSQGQGGGGGGGGGGSSLGSLAQIGATIASFFA